jgi:hypothetical protein
MKWPLDGVAVQKMSRDDMGKRIAFCAPLK